MTESKECRLCHRIGYRGFVPAGGENHIYECMNDRACKTRRARREISRPDLQYRILERLRGFAGPEPEHEEGAMVTDLMTGEESYQQVVSALYRLSAKKLAVAHRWTGWRGGDYGTTFLWYPVRPW